MHAHSSQVHHQTGQKRISAGRIRNTSRERSAEGECEAAASWQRSGSEVSQEFGRQKGRRLQSDLDGPFFTGFLPHSYGYPAANLAKTVLAGVTFRFDAVYRPDS